MAGDTFIKAEAPEVASGHRLQPCTKAASLTCHSGRSGPIFSFHFARAKRSACGCEESLFAAGSEPHSFWVTGNGELHGEGPGAGHESRGSHFAGSQRGDLGLWN